MQSQKLTVFASRFFDYGFRSSHLKMMGEALQGVLGEAMVLHGLAPWGQIETSAWNWFWGRVEAAMFITTDAREKEFAELVCTGWASIQAAYTDEAFGDAFYAEMQRCAPDLLCLFVRPKALQYSTFVQLMETIVQFVHDPEEFYNQVCLSVSLACK